MKYEAVRTYSSEFSVRKMCKVLELTTSGYHNWLKRQSQREEKHRLEAILAKKVREVFEANKKVYGYRKMQIALQKEGMNLSIYKVRKIMRENGLYSVTIEKFKAPRRRNPYGRFHENIVNQKFRPQQINQIWAGDITYIKTSLGWVYLAVVMDLFNKEIIGYSVSKNINTELAQRALSNALTRTDGGGKRTIFHSDRGIQYSSKTFNKMLDKHGLVGSMSRSACPYDNACLESFFSTAKKECLLRKEYHGLEDVKRDLFEYIELFYNRKRMHQSLGYMSPLEYRLIKSTRKIA